ncbi:hypothetical protein [Candidatus Neptunochlamydia vexilliferae]|uniref:Major facilitator superfamily (MFS) profile domain-containing protein n=1 Tax=Candidatus Neptunichlamydia vexilliferae TaxID=1651774 RepID=A0ABS0AZR0_9BACT|nr:hypothetical protein [Candidatus Neptunochlamydia vexilliferae]MBF5059615.1 hypothetical protein [Candidatus Neptunochlamydia vexilliferae]
MGTFSDRSCLLNPKKTKSLDRFACEIGTQKPGTSAENMQGKVMGISQGLGSLSLLFAPILAGVIAGINIAYVYPMAAFLILVSFGVLTAFGHKKTAITE